MPEIASRTHVGLGDVVLALAAGSAATLAFTAGASTVIFDSTATSILSGANTFNDFVRVDPLTEPCTDDETCAEILLDRIFQQAEEIPLKFLFLRSQHFFANNQTAKGLSLIVLSV